MRHAADILDQQIAHWNCLWLKSAKTTLGDQVSNFVKDAEKLNRVQINVGLHGLKKSLTMKKDGHKMTQGAVRNCS